MKLFLYVLREYFKYVIGTTVVIVFLFMLFDFMHKTTKYFAEYNPSSSDVFLFYVYQLPFQVSQTLPISALFGSVVSMVLLSRTNEITVIRAVGLGPSYIISPLAFGGIMLSLISLVINFWVVPFSSKQMRYIQKVSIEGESVTEFAEGPGWVRKEDRLFNFQEFNPLYNRLEHIKLIKLNSEFNLEEMILASNATYVSEDDTWKFVDVSINKFSKNGVLISQKSVKSMYSSLPIQPDKMVRDRRVPDEMSVSELREIIEKGDLAGTDVLAEKISINVKWAYPFAAFFVSLLGIRFAFASERKTESIKGILIAFGVGLSYWFIFSASRAFGARGDLSPFLAAWSANFVMLIIAGFQFWVVRRRN